SNCGVASRGAGDGGCAWRLHSLLPRHGTLTRRTIWIERTESGGIFGDDGHVQHVHTGDKCSHPERLDRLHLFLSAHRRSKDAGLRRGEIELQGCPGKLLALAGNDVACWFVESRWSSALHCRYVSHASDWLCSHSDRVPTGVWLAQSRERPVG